MLQQANVARFARPPGTQEKNAALRCATLDFFLAVRHSPAAATRATKDRHRDGLTN
jgi:hypothetical protein